MKCQEMRLRSRVFDPAALELLQFRSGGYSRLAVAALVEPLLQAAQST